MMEEQKGDIHFEVPPTLDQLLRRIEQDFKKVEAAFTERRELSVTVHILRYPNEK
jgi:hypothetical protein